MITSISNGIKSVDPINTSTTIVRSAGEAKKEKQCKPRPNVNLHRLDTVMRNTYHFVEAEYYQIFMYFGRKRIS